MCINQSDPEERADQVAHMREVYQAASTTIVYLGEDPNEGKAIKYLKRIAMYADPAALLQRRRDHGMDQASRWMFDHITNSNSDHFNNWNALYSMLGQSWWERGWIFQEAIVSKSPIILYGSLKLDFESLTTAIQTFVLVQYKLLAHLVDLTYEDYIQSPMYPNFTTLATGVDFSLPTLILRSWFKRKSVGRGDQPYLKMKFLLQYARMCKTGDPRDRVYAFIGLADPRYGIIPNYKETVAEVFTNATSRILIEEKDPDVIFEALGNVPQRRPNLPTWVADWSCHPGKERYLNRMKSFSASAGFSQCTTFDFPDKDLNGCCGRILRLGVVRVDKLSVAELFLGFESQQDGNAPRRRFDQWRSRTEEHLRSAEHPNLYTWGGPTDACLQAVVFGGASLDHGASVFAHSMGLNKNILTPINMFERRRGAQKYYETMWPFFATPNGFMGRASPGVRHDDDLVLALGASVPMVLRKVEGRDCYTFVGEAYVHGMMNGEAIKLMERGQLRVDEVDII